MDLEKQADTLMYNGVEQYNNGDNDKPERETQNQFVFVGE